MRSFALDPIEAMDSCKVFIGDESSCGSNSEQAFIRNLVLAGVRIDAKDR